LPALRAKGVDSGGEGGQRHVAGEGGRGVRGFHAILDGDQAQAGAGDLDAGLDVGGVGVGDFQYGDGAVADALDGGEGVLAEQHLALAVAGVEFVVGGLDEVAAGIFLDRVGGGGEQGLEQAVLSVMLAMLSLARSRVMRSFAAMGHRSSM
jgi:hypothetical protein